MAFPKPHATLETMKLRVPFHNPIVAAMIPIFLGLAVLPAAAETVDEMLAQLRTAEPAAAARLERRIWREWSRSGSASIDLLLQRGRDALDAGEPQLAIDHFGALIDHAPEFAEGWNMRATAYFQAGRYGPAVADIAQVLARNPRHFGAIAGFARILEETEQPLRALTLYRAALAIHPHLDGVEGAVARLERDTAGQEM
jgi:tetratricopeptide (TPR) repeat protein